MQTLKLTKKYETYPEYKDSGVEWLGLIPKDWNISKAKSFISEIESGVWGDDPKNNDEDIKCLRVADFDFEKLTFKDVETVRNNPDLKYKKILRTGDILLEKSGGGEKTPVGRAVIFNSDEKMVCANFIDIVRVKNDINPKFFAYQLYASYNSKLNLKSIKQNTGIQNLNIRSYFSECYPLPEIKKQSEIVKFLDEKTAFIDQVIEKKERQVELLREEIISLAQNEQQNGKGELVNIRNLVNLHSDQIKIEDNSEYITLGLYNRGRGLFHKEPLLGKDIGESDFSKVKPRDLIISGQFAWEGAAALASEDESECVVSHRYYLLRDGLIKTEYLLALLMTKFGDHILNESSRGSAGRNRPLNIKILLSEKIRVPSKNVEKKAESLLKKMNLARTNIKISIKLLEEYKSSLVSNTVTGKIKV